MPLVKYAGGGLQTPVLECPCLVFNQRGKSACQKYIAALLLLNIDRQMK
jgi:hypothetical protein